MTETIDYNHIPQRQLSIHERLECWAKWVKVRRGTGWHEHPMWKDYRSHHWQWAVPEIHIPVNTIEAMQTEKAVGALPEKNREAVRWCYVFQTGPVSMARRLAVSKQGLADLVTQGRDMLKNRLHD